MEVHDVVVECSRVMLENIERPSDNPELIGPSVKHVECNFGNLSSNI